MLTLRLTLMALALSGLLRPESLSLLDGGKANLSFTWQQATDKTATFVVYNSGDKNQEIETGAVFPGASRILSTISPRTAIIPPHTSARFTFTASYPRPPAAKYVGTVEFSQADGKPAIPALILTLTVPGPEVPLLKDTVTLWRATPFGPWIPAIFPLPLTVPDVAKGLGGVNVGAVRRDAGGWALVRWARSDQLAQGPALAVCDPPSAGAYTGDITLALDPVKTSLNLTVIAKDIVVWPLLVIVIGVTLAYLVKRYVGVLRNTWQLRIEEADLGGAFRDAQSRFADIASGHTYGAYSIAEDLGKQRQVVLSGLSAVERSPVSTLDDKNTMWNRAVITLAAIRNAISLWPTFAGSLSGLDAALQSLAEDVEQSTAGSNLRESAQEILRGHPISIDSLSGLNQTALTLTSQILGLTLPSALTESAATFTARIEIDHPAGDQRRAEILQRRIARSDTQAALFAGSIAILTGISQLYLGKPFGTLSDYVALFLWAAGTKAALDVVLVVVDKLAPVATKP